MLTIAAPTGKKPHLPEERMHAYRPVSWANSPEKGWPTCASSWMQRLDAHNRMRGPHAGGCARSHASGRERRYSIAPEHTGTRERSRPYRRRRFHCLRLSAQVSLARSAAVGPLHLPHLLSASVSTATQPLPGGAATVLGTVSGLAGW